MQQKTITGDIYAWVGVSVSCYSHNFQVTGPHREALLSEWLFWAGWQNLRGMLG